MLCYYFHWSFISDLFRLSAFGAFVAFGVFEAFGVFGVVDVSVTFDG